MFNTRFFNSIISNVKKAKHRDQLQSLEPSDNESGGISALTYVYFAKGDLGRKDLLIESVSSTGNQFLRHARLHRQGDSDGVFIEFTEWQLNAMDNEKYKRLKELFQSYQQAGAHVYTWNILGSKERELVKNILIDQEKAAKKEMIYSKPQYVTITDTVLVAGFYSGTSELELYGDQTHVRHVPLTAANETNPCDWAIGHVKKAALSEQRSRGRKIFEKIEEDYLFDLNATLRELDLLVPQAVKSPFKPTMFGSSENNKEAVKLDSKNTCRLL